jgi:hypothetical protein
MEAWTGVMLSCASLLVISGIPKLQHPGATVNALRSVGVSWVGGRMVRILTAVEIGCGSVAIVIGGRWADATVAVVYAGFSIFLVRALRTPVASCGCTGRDDTPPTPFHLVMTAAFAAGAVAAVAAGGRTGLVTLARDADTLELLGVVAFAALAAWLGWSILTLSLRTLPRTSH